MSLENSPFKISALNGFEKELILPSSKSYTNRALIIGAIRGNNFKINNYSSSTDVLNLINSFKIIGLKMKISSTTIVFENSFPDCEKETTGNMIEIKTGDGGTTNRFLIALLSRGKKEYYIYPSGRMSDRPIEDQLVALKKINVQITHNKNSDSNTPWVIVKGPAFFPVNQKLEVDCEKSTQFATALMLAFSDTTLKLDLLKLEASESYVKMTNQLIMDCSKQDSYCVPLDFSSLGYPAAIASLLGRVLIKNCTEIDALQADSEIIKLLKNAGASRSLSIDGLEIKKSKKLKPFTFNISQAPDLFPTLVFLAAHIEGTSCLDNLVVLQYKESDRLNEMINILKVFEVDFNYDPETSKLKINGRDNFKYKKATVECAKDHRIVMAAALFMAKNSGGELYNIDCVDKSYPNFLKLLEG